MRAKFEFEYDGKGNVEVEVSVEAEMQYDNDKKDFIQSVADILGIPIEVKDTLAEQIWNDVDKMTEALQEYGNENKDN